MVSLLAGPTGQLLCLISQSLIVKWELPSLVENCEITVRVHESLTTKNIQRTFTSFLFYCCKGSIKWSFISFYSGVQLNIFMFEISCVKQSVCRLRLVHSTPEVNVLLKKEYSLKFLGIVNSSTKELESFSSMISKTN